MPRIEKTAPSRRLSPVDRAYNYVLDLIISGELRPGMRIPTETIAEAISVSRMPVRDALRRLEGDGVVTIFANRGASVAEYSIAEIVELTEMRAALEGLAAGIARKAATPAESEELEHYLVRLERAEGDLAKWMACHDDFHNYLTSLARRPLLLEQTERMRLMVRPYFREFVARSGEYEIEGLEHRRIFEAMKSGSGAALDRIMRDHVSANIETVARLATETV